MDKIGVRELRQNASIYLARVCRGERIEFTDRGRPVAMLIPMPTDSWEQMITSGEVKPATDPTSPADEEPIDFGVSMSAILEEMRRDER